MSEFSPVARCTCRHIYSAHNGRCHNPHALGQCRCPSFSPHADQIYIDTLALLSSHIHAFGYAPTVRELLSDAGVSSTATMNARLEILETAGLIERVGPRAIRLIEVTDE